MKYSVDQCIQQCQEQAKINLEPEFTQFMEDTATYLISFQESDEVFRRVIEKLTVDNGGTNKLYGTGVKVRALWCV